MEGPREGQAALLHPERLPKIEFRLGELESRIKEPDLLQAAVPVKVR
jgi:hypothetical protein